MSMFASKAEWIEYTGGATNGAIVAYLEQATFMPNVANKDLWYDAVVLGTDAFFGGKLRGMVADGVHGAAIGSAFDLVRKTTKDFLVKQSSGSSSTSASAVANPPARQDAIAPVSNHAHFDEMPEIA